MATMRNLLVFGFLILFVLEVTGVPDTEKEVVKKKSHHHREHHHHRQHRHKEKTEIKEASPSPSPGGDDKKGGDDGGKGGDDAGGGDDGGDGGEEVVEAIEKGAEVLKNIQIDIQDVVDLIEDLGKLIIRESKGMTYKFYQRKLNPTEMQEKLKPLYEGLKNTGVDVLKGAIKKAVEQLKKKLDINGVLDFTNFVTPAINSILGLGGAVPDPSEISNLLEPLKNLLPLDNIPLVKPVKDVLQKTLPLQSTLQGIVKELPLIN